MDYLKQKEVPTLMQILADQLVRDKPTHPERYLAAQLQMMVLQQRGIERVQFVIDDLSTTATGADEAASGAGAPATAASGPTKSAARVEVVTCLGTHATEIQGGASEEDSHAYAAALSSLIGVAPDDLKSVRTCLEKAAPLIGSEALVAVIDALCHTVAAVQVFQQEHAASGALLPMKPLFLRLKAWQALAGAHAISAEKPDVAGSSESELFITLAGGSTAGMSLASSGWHPALASRVGVCVSISREIVCKFGGQQKLIDSVKTRAFVSCSVSAELFASHSLDHSLLYPRSIRFQQSPQSALQEAGCLFASSIGTSQRAVEEALVCVQEATTEQYKSWEPEADMQQLALMVISSALKAAGFEPFIELPRISPCEEDTKPAKKKKPAKGKTGKKGKAAPGSADSTDPADSLALVEIADEVGLKQVIVGGEGQIQVTIKDAMHFYQKHAARFNSRLIAGESWFHECRDALTTIGVVECSASSPGNVYEPRIESLKPATP